MSVPLLALLFLMQVLRKALDSSGLGNVQIVAADSSFQGIASDVLKDPVLNSSVSILGLVHVD